MPDSRISRVRFEALAFLPRAFPAWRGLSAGSHTPQLPWFAHSLVPPQASALRQHCVWPPRCSMDPPSAQSPFAPMLVFPSSGRRVHHLLRGRYASVIAPTDSFANPVWLFLPSAIASCKKSSQVATSPCCHRDFPDVISANLSSDAWSLATAVPRSAYTCFFLRVIGLPQQGCGSASRFNPRTRLFAEAFFSRLQTFLYVQASEFARLPDRSYRCAYRRRAAETSTSGQSVLRYLRTHRTC